MDYDYKEKKVVVILDSKLEMGIAFNVISHLALSIGYHAKNHMGRDCYKDKSGINHAGICKYPIIITKVKSSKLRAAIQLARDNQDIILSDYPQEMLSTGHDNELASSLLNIDEAEIKYYGAIIFGKTRDVDAITGRFTLWK